MSSNTTMTRLLLILVLFTLYQVSFSQPVIDENGVLECTTDNPCGPVATVGVITGTVTEILCIEPLSCVGGDFDVTCDPTAECKIECSGEPSAGTGSCEASRFTIFGPTKDIICDKEMSCVETTFQVINPTEDFTLACKEMASCASGMLTLFITPDATESEFGGILCEEVLSCSMFDIDIQNLSPNTIIWEEIKCADEMSCMDLDISRESTGEDAGPIIILEVNCEEEDSCTNCVIDGVACVDFSPQTEPPEPTEPDEESPESPEETEPSEESEETEGVDGDDASGDDDIADDTTDDDATDDATDLDIADNDIDDDATDDDIFRVGHFDDDRRDIDQAEDLADDGWDLGDDFTLIQLWSIFGVIIIICNCLLFGCYWHKKKRRNAQIIEDVYN